MKIQIDQSSKIEYTSKNTVIAFSNGRQKSLLIKASDKRKLEEIFREIKRPEIFVYKTFAVLVYLLIRADLKDIQEIIIDQEYQGKEPIIKDFLLQIIRKNHKNAVGKEEIFFSCIGKKSRAHQKALQTFQGKIKPDLVVGFKNVIEFLFK